MEKVSKITIIFSFFAVYTHTLAPSVCPQICRCDSYAKVANCSGFNLISPYTDIQFEVELLDLSYNTIIEIDNACLQDYQRLIYLDLSHNIIQMIHVDAFSKLAILRSIDLSYNNLRKLNDYLFMKNSILQALDLEGNDFSYIPNKPLIRSRSLRTLILRNCKITYLSAKMFSDLPQMEYLDISRNKMVVLKEAPLNPAQSLHTIILNENPWKCDMELLDLVKRLQQRRIYADLGKCQQDDVYVEGPPPREIHRSQQELRPSDSYPIELGTDIQVVGVIEEDANTLSIKKSDLIFGFALSAFLLVATILISCTIYCTVWKRWKNRNHQEVNISALNATDTQRRALPSLPQDTEPLQRNSGGQEPLRSHSILYREYIPVDSNRMSNESGYIEPYIPTAPIYEELPIVGKYGTPPPSYADIMTKK